MKINKPTVVIAGGGFAGLKAALDLSKTDHYKIILICDKDSFSFNSTLYRTATGISSEVSSLPFNEVLDTSKLEIVRSSVEKLDRATKTIITNDGKEFKFDYLILALGVVANYFGIDGLKELSYGIKTLQDVDKFKYHLHKQITDESRPDLNYVVVGGGPTGIELAGALGDYVKYICKNHGIKDRKVHVDLVEAANRLLPRMPKDVSRQVIKRLRNRGVAVRLNAKVQGQDSESLMVNSKPIRSHTVVWTAGVANNPFFENNGFQLSKNHKVRVDQFLQAEPSIFVLGDNADTPYSGMAQTAINDGRYVAKFLTDIASKKSANSYVAKKPVYVIPVGPNWAAVQWGEIRIYGILGWWLRRAADLIGYRDYEDFFKATKHWFADYEKEDLCAVCEPNKSLLY